MLAAFGTYFCMYGFRKPFTAATYGDETIAGVGLKTVLVTAQVLGYSISKFIGIKVISEMPPGSRAKTLIGLVERFIAEVGAGTHAKSGFPSSAYRVSKVALNAHVRILARELSSDPRRILVNATCPGWVKTRMGGNAAPTSVEEGADTPVWLAMLPEGGPTGGFFRNQQAIPF